MRTPEALAVVLMYVSAALALPCEEARVLCLYRTGCANAMQSYLWKCTSSENGCPEHCQHALIALTSTPEGKQLMTCECSDETCLMTKKKAELCRPHVLWATKNESVVSCRIAQSICHADAECANALEYYHRLCRAMFHGNKCTRRCKNSISILRRQRHAFKLNTCLCDGREEYDCAGIQENMARLCYPSRRISPGPSNELVTSSSSSTGGIHPKESATDNALAKEKDMHQDSPGLASQGFLSWKLLTTCLTFAVATAVT